MGHLIIPPSKSQILRWLVLQSFSDAPRASNPTWSSRSEIWASEIWAKDAQNLQAGLTDLSSREIWVGSGAAPLRFLALRLSREKGSWRLCGTPELFKRPQEGLQKLIQAVGAQVSLGENSLEIRSEGWKPIPETDLDPILCRDSTSQLLSALALSSFGMPDWIRAIQALPPVQEVSAPYVQMTFRTLKQWGWPERLVAPSEKLLEPDASCSFSIAALAAIRGDVRVPMPTLESLQADAVFPQVLKKLGARLSVDGDQLRVRGARLVGSEFALGSSPDLFPVLASLAGVASGPSILGGAPHLKFKESNRILEASILLRAMGRYVVTMDDGVAIASEVLEPTRITVDPRGDHRVVMAAQVANRAGFDFEILDRNCVEKSFPNYWECVEELK